MTPRRLINAQIAFLLIALLVFFFLSSAFAGEHLVKWTPAMKDVKGNPLPGDQLTQIMTSDCSGRTYTGWGKYNTRVTERAVSLPELKPCECVLTRTVVPSFPAAIRESSWVTVEACNGADAGVCH